jgi:integrase
MSGSGGQIRQRKSGLWEGRYVGADHRRHSVYGRTRRDAQEKMRAALMAADHGIRPASGRLTVDAWLEEWLMTSVQPRNRPRTLDSYRETVDRYIDPTIGRIPLTRLQPEDVAGMLRRLSARGLSATTVRYAHAVLRIALGRAVKSGRVVRNVASLVEPPARRTAERRPLTADQARAFLDAVIDDRLAAMYVLAIATGMRQGELLALRWQDVDIDGARLTIRHTLRLGTRELAEPKTERARRTLRLGTDSVLVSRILGHSQIATTADVYAHLTPAMLERSAARMDSILARRPEAASG